MNSVPAIANIGGLLLLLLIVFSILGSFLFWNVAHGDYIDGHANFSDFPTSFIRLSGRMWPPFFFGLKNFFSVIVLWSVL